VCVALAQYLMHALIVGFGRCSGRHYITEVYVPALPGCSITANYKLPETRAYIYTSQVYNLRWPPWQHLAPCLYNMPICILLAGVIRTLYELQFPSLDPFRNWQD
jgi:hypothetical protein